MAKKSATPAPEAPEPLTRHRAAALVLQQLQGLTSLDDVIAAADRLYAEAGGESNLREQAGDVKRALKYAEAFGLVKVDHTVTVRPAK